MKTLAHRCELDFQVPLDPQNLPAGAVEVPVVLAEDMTILRPRNCGWNDVIVLIGGTPFLTLGLTAYSAHD